MPEDRPVQGVVVSLPLQRAFVSQDMAVLVYQRVHHDLLGVAGDSDQGATISDKAGTVAIWNGRVQSHDDRCVSRVVPPKPP